MTGRLTRLGPARTTLAVVGAVIAVAGAIAVVATLPCEGLACVNFEVGYVVAVVGSLVMGVALRGNLGSVPLATCIVLSVVSVVTFTITHAWGPVALFVALLWTCVARVRKMAAR